MSKNVDFETGTIVTDVFLDAIQELQTGSMRNLRLAPSSIPAATDRIAVALSGDVVNDKRGTANIAGKYVYFDQIKDSAPAASGNGTKNIYLSLTENGPTQQPNFDITVDTSPPVNSYVRIAGTVQRTGAQLHGAKLINGSQAEADQYNSFTFRSVFDYSDETLLRLEGQSAQTSLAGTTKSDPSATPTKALSVSENGNEHLYIDTLGRLVWRDPTNSLDAVLQWNAGTGATENSSILVLNRILGSFREGENALVGQDNPTLDGVQVNYTRNRGFNSFIARALDADTENRFQVSSTGVVEWGDGSSTPDTGFYRVSADALAMLPNDKFYMDYTIVEATDTGKLATNKEYVDAQDSAAVSTSRRFSFFIGK